ncbi:hypothetical protein CSIRO_0909 [Bradyrhizobiaceae bacterium SG-6C]|nr:hypothetical protein CSIRO_0909 [Bradyrhizobiaceae bacterium SG-6C]
MIDFQIASPDFTKSIFGRHVSPILSSQKHAASWEYAVFACSLNAERS